MARLFRLLPLFWLFLAGGVASAVSGDDGLVSIPPLSAHVVDLAGLLQPAQASDLDRRLMRFEEAHGSQIAVLIVPTTAPEAIEQYSIRVFDAWKLGRKQYNDGILIVVAAQDRALRIDAGYGLEGAIPDVVAKRVVMETMAPKFRAGDPYGGIVAGVEQIGRLIAGEQLPAPAGRSTSGSLDQLLVVGLVAATIVGGVLSLLLGRFFGGIATGGVVGAIAWFMSGSLFAAIAAAFMVFLFVLARGGRGGSPFGGWGGGGWSSGGGGGWGGGGGGGGSAGGGGASGNW